MFDFLLRRIRNAIGEQYGPRMPTHVRRLDRADDHLSGELILTDKLSDGDFILCLTGEIVPRDGMVIDGSAGSVIGLPVSAGTTVLPNLIVVRVGAFEPGQGRKTSGPTSCSRAPATSRDSSRMRRVKSL